MKYQNVRTGAVITTSSPIGGGDWVPFGAEVKPAVKVEAEHTAQPIAPTPAPAGDGIDGVTVKQIKQELDSLGISYDAKARKQELYDLMMKG
ncbi:hypothetical protein [Lacticaseibacillus parakribbianus]|uniref:hypothetical protein n=1 Tax=Lacticaseibacillus parakribbianus TaxID=2970927 RepID=UPI0021CB07BB|nr:hypothetical protein [Lacticaseibacillus parakribbianus]